MGTNLEATPRARVLVVDDDPAVRGVHVAMLQREGYLVESAGGTTEALELLERTPDVALVLTDMHMPDRDGMELLREMRRRFPDVAAVMVTGDGDVVTAVESIKLGGRDYLTKPVGTHEMYARVGKALEDRRSELEYRRLRERYQADLEQQVSELAQKNKRMFLAQVQMAVTILEEKDSYTRGHSRRVADYAVATGRKLGLAEELLREIHLGGELHDIGKIGTRDAVLNKPTKLTAEEFAHVREHTIAGERMLSVLRDEHPDVLHITRWHHEQMDGSGFPDGLRGAKIPLTARIVGVVDAFDAMTSGRRYAQDLGIDWALGELKRCAGTQFDPDVVDAFLAAYAELTASTEES